MTQQYLFLKTKERKLIDLHHHVFKTNIMHDVLMKKFLMME